MEEIYNPLAEFSQLTTLCWEIQGARAVLVFPPMDRRIFLDHIRRTRFAPGDKAAAQRDARRVARYLVGQGAARVFGIGSAFVSGRRFTRRSDIDLAVEALDPRRFFGASAKAAEMTDFELDVIPVESASEAMLCTIRGEGVEL